MSPLLAWFESLAPRERVTLAAGAVLLTLMLAWFLIVEPLADERSELTQRIRAQERGVAWMEAAVDTLGEASGSRRGKVERDDRSLLALVDETVRTHNLADALRRAEPDTSGAVRLWFEAVSFDRLIEWMVAMDSNYGVSVTEFGAESRPDPGSVDARVTVRDS